MKKIFVLFLTAVIAMAMLLPAAAMSFNQGEYCEIEVTVKKTDPSKVVKDGIISEGEYEKAPIDTNPATSNLTLGYGNSIIYEKAEAMMQTAEYYFSWDDTNGLNIAVKYKPETIFQELDVLTGDMPCDNFLCNCGIHLSIDSMLHNPDLSYEHDMIYRFAVGKRTDDGRYLVGWYEAQGASGRYVPEPEKDFIINYTSDGYIICEWSVPFAEINCAGEGSTVYLSLAVTAGDGTGTDINDTIDGAYSVSLGDYGYLGRRSQDSQNGTFVLSGEMIAGGQGQGGNEETGGNGEATEKVTAVETYLTTNEKGETVVETRIVEQNVSNNKAGNANAGKRTGDPMIIIAAVSAVSACGAVLLKKKH